MRDATALQLVNAWQRGFPLAPRPFAEIAARSGLSETEVIESFERFRANGVIDRIGPVFRPNTVGASTLAAMAVPPERLETVAALVSRRESVNHNYEREHRCNLWFVVAASGAAAVEKEILLIEEQAGLPVLRLPLLEEYHIDLGFDLVDHRVPRGERRRAEPAPMTPEEKRLVARVARGIPLVRRPYAALGLPEEAAIAALGRWLQAGVVRRIGAVVRHRPLGYTANAMVAWDVADENAAEIGRRLAADPAVTLCYRRARALPQWPYNLYCMIHGRSRARVLQEVKRMRESHGLKRFARSILFSRRCFSQRAAHYG